MKRMLETSENAAQCQTQQKAFLETSRSPNFIVCGTSGGVLASVITTLVM